MFKGISFLIKIGFFHLILLCINFLIRVNRQACNHIENGYRPKVILIIAQKNHHTKLFQTNQSKGNELILLLKYIQINCFTLVLTEKIVLTLN